MKKLIIVLLVALAINCKVDAQAPQGFNFQGIALDSTGYVVTSKLVSLRFSISTDSLGNTVSYSETASTQTDKYGQFTVVIGNGISVIGNFASINWSFGNLYMKTEIDIANTGKYVVTGLSKLLSVPYALQANSASNINSDSLHNTRAGSGSLYQNAIGTKNTAIGKSALYKNKNGYGNTAIGESALYFNSDGNANTAIGDSSLYSNTQGIGNQANGYLSLYSNTAGSQNAAIGFKSLYSNTLGNENTAIGEYALTDNTTGSLNIAIGTVASQSNTTGKNNTAIGTKTLRWNKTGFSNTAIGAYALTSINTGSNNTAIGDSSLLYFSTGGFNTAIGNFAGGKLTTGYKNIFIGNEAGNNLSLSTVSNKLVIQNDSSVSPLIYGEFDTKKLTVNGKLIVGDPSILSSSAVLEASSTTQGFLPPRLTYAQKMAIINPATGLVVFCTDCGPPRINGELEVFSGGIWRNMNGAEALGVAASLPSATIGSQVWTNINLDVSTYRNGDIIPQVTDSTAWVALTTGAWCYYNNDSTLGAKYGKLYNWYAVNDPRGLAPSGYHIPSNADITTLTTYLGGDLIAGVKMKEKGILNWNGPNSGATNESGFTGLPGGSRTNGEFKDIRSAGLFWSSTTATEQNVGNGWIRSIYSWAPGIANSTLNKNLGAAVRCLRDSTALGLPPTVSSTTAATITTYNYLGHDSIYVKSGGKITSDGGSAITARGVCWSNSQNPTTADSKTTDDGTTGTFDSWLKASSWSSALVGATTYYVRSYATNGLGTEYGNQVSFTTANFVTIGSQVWTNKNLEVSTYRNGDIIPQVTDSTAWVALTTGAWCYPNNDSTLGAKYGKLYNWYAVDDPRGLAPLGWHVSSDDETEKLKTYLGAYSGLTVGGVKMMDANPLNWDRTFNSGATNESGFTGLPGGSRKDNGVFSTIRQSALFWTSTTCPCGTGTSGQNAVQAWIQILNGNAQIQHGYLSKKYGASVRCLRD
jgi:uncharacterized protein (TIGR02145 family)